MWRLMVPGVVISIKLYSAGVLLSTLSGLAFDLEMISLAHETFFGFS